MGCGIKTGFTPSTTLNHPHTLLTIINMDEQAMASASKHQSEVPDFIVSPVHSSSYYSITVRSIVASFNLQVGWVGTLPSMVYTSFNKSLRANLFPKLKRMSEKSHVV